MNEEKNTEELGNDTQGIDIDSLKKAFDDLEAANKAGDEKGINDALTTLKKLINDALGEKEDPKDEDPEDDPFAKAADKYK